MGLGVVAIADPPTAICLKVPFSDGLGGKLSNPYFVYIKKVFNWIGELSEEVHVSKTRLFFDYAGSVLMHG